MSLLRISVFLLLALSLNGNSGVEAKKKKKSQKNSPAVNNDKMPSAPIQGGHSPADVNSKDVKTAAHKAIKFLNDGQLPELKQQLGIKGRLTLVKIKSATQQPVAGTIYDIVMTVSGHDAKGGHVKAGIRVSMFVQLWMKPAYMLQSALPAIGKAK